MGSFMTEEMINLVYACDENYAQHMAISMMSAEMYTDKFINFYVFDAGIKDESKDKIKASVTNGSVTFITIDISDFKDFPKTIDYISIATYFRLKLPTYLSNVDKVIYIDVDAVVGGDLYQLWLEPLNGKPVGAVIDPTIEFFSDNYKINLGLENEQHYFNAGVLLIDVNKLREVKFESNVIDFFHEYGSIIKYQDQDILNGVLKGNVQYLNAKYNYMPSYKKLEKKELKISDRLNHLLIKDGQPIIFHFCGTKKPWYLSCSHDGFEIYEKILSLSLWKSYKITLDSNDNRSKLLQYKYKRFIRRFKK